MDKTEQDLRESASCDFCSTQYTPSDWDEGGAHDFRIRDNGLYYYDSQCDWEGIEVKYCPMCEQELGLPQPLTPDRLKQIIGEPVYIVFMDSFIRRWGIVERFNNGYVTFTDGNYYSLNGYGEKWLAYRRKPEQEE